MQNKNKHRRDEITGRQRSDKHISYGTEFGNPCCCKDDQEVADNTSNSDKTKDKLD